MGFCKNLLIENNFQRTAAMDNMLYKRGSNVPKSEDLCPICKKKPPHSFTKTVKLGNFDGYRFHSTGTEERTTHWWACKACTKNTPTDEYIERMIEDYNNKHSNAEEKKK